MDEQISPFCVALQAVRGLFSAKLYESPIQACPVKTIVGTAWRKEADAVFPGQQTYQNCGVQSARQIVEQALHACLKENELEFLDRAINSCGVERGKIHPNDSGGTSAIKRRCILKQFGIDSTVQKASLSNVDNALRSGQGVIISADVNVLWKDQPNIDPQSGRHAVVVTHGGYDNNGKLLGVYVNDTGIDRRYYLSTSELEDALESGSGSINVTDNRIWPANE